MINILKWCDEKISYLKANGIEFKNGMPILPDESYYRNVPKAIIPFMYRNDILESQKADSLICFFNNDSNLFTRIEKLDEEIPVMKEYAGICGFDLSPSIGMLRPRQVQSILINSIYDCYCAVNGIKVLPNYRVGDNGTLGYINRFPEDASFIIGQLGCQNHGFKHYGLYQLRMILENKSPNKVFVYGNLPVKTAKPFLEQKRISFYVYPDRRNRVRNSKEPFVIAYRDGMVISEPLSSADCGGIVA